MQLSIGNLHDIFTALRVPGQDGHASSMSLAELGLYGSINLQDAEVAACQPIVDFISAHAPQLKQFDIRLPQDEQHAVRFEVQFQ